MHVRILVGLWVSSVILLYFSKTRCRFDLIELWNLVECQALVPPGSFGGAWPLRLENLCLNYILLEDLDLWSKSLPLRLRCVRLPVSWLCLNHLLGRLSEGHLSLYGLVGQASWNEFWTLSLVDEMRLDVLAHVSHWTANVWSWWQALSHRDELLDAWAVSKQFVLAIVWLEHVIWVVACGISPGWWGQNLMCWSLPTLQGPLYLEVWNRNFIHRITKVLRNDASTGHLFVHV